MDLAELVHHLYLGRAFMCAMIVSYQDQLPAPIFGQDVALDVRHELDDAGAFGGLVDLEIPVVLQAVGDRAHQGESLAPILRVGDLEPLASVPPRPSLHHPSTCEVS